MSTPSARVFWPFLLLALACLFVGSGPDARAGLLTGTGWQIVTSTSDTSNHVWTFSTTSGHVYHLTVDWTCVWSGGANADAGKTDVACTDSSGTVTCATGATTPSEHIGTEGCNNPAITAGTGDSYNVTISASTTSAVNWLVWGVLNAN